MNGVDAVAIKLTKTRVQKKRGVVARPAIALENIRVS